MDEGSSQQSSAQVSPDEFAAKIKAQYPQYAHVDSSVLTEKMLEKYPVYRDKVKMEAPTETQQRAAELGQSPSLLMRSALPFAQGVKEGFTATPPKGPPTMNATPPMAQTVGRFVGREGPAIAGGAAMMGATGGLGALPAMAAAGLGGGAGEAYRQIFGTNPLLGEKGLTQDEAAKLITVRAMEQAVTEGTGRLAGGAINLIRGASLKQLAAVTNLPMQYVNRAMERPGFAIPKVGETLASVEAAAMKHFQAVQEGLQTGRAAAGQAVDRALEAVHIKTGGKAFVDTDPLAQAVRKVIGDMDGAGDPTLQALTRGDREKISELLKTMEARDDVALPSGRGGRGNMPTAASPPPGRMGAGPDKITPVTPDIDPLTGAPRSFQQGGTPSYKIAPRGPLHQPSLGSGVATPSNFTQTPMDPLTGGARAPGPVDPNALHAPSYGSGGGAGNAPTGRSAYDPGNLKGITQTRGLKTFKNVVMIRREIDNLINYTAQGLPKMESDVGQRFMRQLGSELRDLISKTAEQQGDKQLLLANSRFSNVASNYDEWQPVLNTRTEGEPHLYARVNALGNYVGKGGAPAQSLETLKEAFPGAARSVDALHDALARRALLKAEEVPSKNFITNLMKQAAGSRAASPAEAIKAVRTKAGSSAPDVARGGASMSAAVLNALLSHIQPEERKK